MKILFAETTRFWTRKWDVGRLRRGITRAGKLASIGLIAGLTFLSGLVVALRMRETLEAADPALFSSST